MADDVSLPYKGTSGWSGSSTSHDRAVFRDASGVTAAQQKTALRALAMAGERGLIVHEVTALLRDHHGSASGVLSNLHFDYRIARLTEKRDRCAIYVLPAFICGRETAPHKRHEVKTDE